MIRKLLCLFALATLAMAVAAEPTAGRFDARAFGATGDGKTLDTRAIQTAIDAAAKAGGGRVVLAGGTFLSGTIVLKTGVILDLEAGTTLRGSTRLADYPPHIPALRSYTDIYTDKSLIYAERQERIGLEGRGTIDGQGGAPVFQNKPYKLRPYLIRIIECRDVAVRGVTLVNSPMWVEHYLGCANVLIDGITVRSTVNQNNDGIDIDASEQVRIANCDITSGDDAIVLKSTTDRPCRRVTVTNCVLSSRCNAFKTGTESNGGFQDITFSNSVIHDTGLSGIALELVDGGVFERVGVANVTMENTQSGIFVRLGNRARPFKAGQGKVPMGSMKDIIIRDVQGDGIGRTACSITGLPGHDIENVTLENIRMRFSGGSTTKTVNAEVPEKEKSYPEYRIFGELPAYGFYVRHARNVRFAGFDLAFRENEPRPAILFDDVRDAELRDIKVQLSLRAPARFWFRNVVDAVVQGCRPEGGEAPLLMVEGASTDHIRLWDNDLSGLSEPVRQGREVKPGAVVK